MVKIPNLDELKKMGSSLLDQAKSVNIGGMVDKVKASVESVGKKTPPEFNNESLKNAFTGLYATLKELAETQNAQLAVVKKIETQLEQLALMVEASQTPPAPADLINEVKKKDE